MPTAKLTYTLPEEQGDYDAARLGRQMVTTIWEIDQHLRSICKHGEPTTAERHLAEAVRAMIRNGCPDALAHGGELFDEAAAEIERLRSPPCPYVTGSVTHYCTLSSPSLTDAEREAVEWAAKSAAPYYTWHTATLRGLLARMA